MGLASIMRSKMDEVSRNLQKMAEDAAKKPAEAKPATEKASVSKSQYKVPKHPVTKENKTFVEKNGFGDLKNDQLRQVRDKARAILKGLKKADSADPRVSLSKRAEEFIQKAGSDPKLRKNLDTLYRIVARDRPNLTATNAMQIMDLLGRPGHEKMADSTSARAATVALVKSPAYGKNKAVYLKARNIVQAAANANTHPKKISDAVEGMNSYVAETANTHADISRAIGWLDRLKVPVKKAYRDIFQTHLDRIAGDKNPKENYHLQCGQARSVANDVVPGVEATVTQRYQDVLKKNGVSEARAYRAAKKIWEWGGPQTPAGLLTIAALGRKRFSADDQEKVRSWVADISHRMSRSTCWYQQASVDAADPRLARGQVDHLAPPRQASIPKPNLLTRGAVWMDGAGVGGQIADTMGTIGGLLDSTTLEVAGGGTAMFLAFATIPFTLSSLGYTYRKLDAQEEARFGHRGYEAAVEMARHTHLLSPGEAYDRIRIRASGVLREKGLHAFQDNFYNTYKAFASLPYKHRTNLINAMDWIDGGMSGE